MQKNPAVVCSGHGRNAYAPRMYLSYQRNEKFDGMTTLCHQKRSCLTCDIFTERLIRCLMSHPYATEASD